MVGEIQLGYVERVGEAWLWYTRPIPGPIGAFDEGSCSSEFEARRRVEQKWQGFVEAA